MVIDINIQGHLCGVNRMAIIPVDHMGFPLVVLTHGPLRVITIHLKGPLIETITQLRGIETIIHLKEPHTEMISIIIIKGNIEKTLGTL